MHGNGSDVDHEIYKQLVELWARENPIKTSKLQALLVVNGLLLSAVTIGGGFQAKSWPLYAGGTLFSLVWVLSIGRTSLFQEVWQRKIAQLQGKHPGDERFRVLDAGEPMREAPGFLRLLGGVPSKYYLLGAPLALCLVWLGALLYFVLR